MWWRSLLELAGKDVEEFVFTHQTIPIGIGTMDQFFQLGLRDVLTQFLSHSSEVLH
jgi:hypothetical protein